MENENRTKPKLFDHRSEQLINTSEIPFIMQAVKFFGDIKYWELFKEGEVYSKGINYSVVVPQGKSWIKLRAQRAVGEGFSSFWEKVNEFKKEQEKIQAKYNSNSVILPPIARSGDQFHGL